MNFPGSPRFKKTPIFIREEPIENAGKGLSAAGIHSFLPVTLYVKRHPWLQFPFQYVRLTLYRSIEYVESAGTQGVA